MKFVCERCQTRYSIADEKVRQKILRIRCKTCGGVILVQESAAGPERSAEGSDPHLSQHAALSAGSKLPASPPKAASGPKSRPAAGARAPSEPVPSPAAPVKMPSGPKGPPASPSKSPSGPKSPPTESQRARAAMPPPPPPPAPAVAHDPLGGRVEWYVATDGAQSGPFSRTEAAKRILAIDPARAVHVWKEGMPAWKAASEVSVIAREINLLRPVPPPPPSPASSATPAPVVSPPAGRVPGKPGAPVDGFTPAPVPGAASGKPSAPPSIPASIADALADPDAEAFLEADTRKRDRMVDAVTTRTPAPVSNATTRKGKGLRDLESAPPSTPVLPDTEELLTPPPVRPLPPVGAKRADVPPPRSTLPESPTVPNPVPQLTLESEPSVTFDLGEDTRRAPSAAGGFSEVVAAMAGSAPAGPSAPAIMSTAGVDPAAALLSFAPKKSRVAELFERQPGLKYVVAAVALVVLVLLLVLVILRGNAVKVPEVNKEPAKEEPAKPEELAKPEPPAPPPEKQPTVMPVEEPRPSGGPSSGSRHSSGRTRVEKPATAKRPSQTSGRVPGGDLARPNPFAETGKTVSQGQISAVVRNSANQAGLRACYERALKMDNNLTSGRMDVTVSISASGAVQQVAVNAPSGFMLIEPCIKAAVRRWRFPPSSEEYGTNFPLILQGGM